MSRDRILLIDADSLIYFEAYRDTLQEAIEGIDKRMNRIFEETESNKFIMFLTEGKCFRYKKAVSKDYKDARKTRSKPKWFYALKSYLKAQYGAISIEGLEADDCVVYFKHKIPHAMICSIDKDVLQQCVGTHYNYQLVSIKNDAGEIIGHKSKGFIETYVEDADRFLHTQMLMGEYRPNFFNSVKAKENLC